MSLRTVLSAGGLFLLTACAGVKEVEELSKLNKVYLEEYYKDLQSVEVDLNPSPVKVPSFREPLFIKVRAGSWKDPLGNVHSRHDVFIKIEEEDYGTEID